MPTEMAAIATIAVSANNQRGNGSSISFPPVKTAGFFKGLQTARQKHERDYFVVRLRLTIPQRMNCTPKVGCQRIFAGSFSADPAFRAEQLRSFTNPSDQRECCPRGSSPSERFKTKTVKQQQLVDFAGNAYSTSLSNCPLWRNGQNCPPRD